MKRLFILAAAIALPAAAQTTTTTTSTTSTASTATASQPAMSEQKLVDKWSDLAGSDKNSKSLVDGLRDSKKVTLTDGKTSTTFDPPTKKMGYGNVNAALAIAEKTLADAGIANPTTEQLKTALMGGTITTKTGTVKLEGVLQMRADGMGWGQIANKLGFRMGEVVGNGRVKASETAQQHGGAKVERVAHGADRPERPNKVERPERPAKPERNGK